MPNYTKPSFVVFRPALAIINVIAASVMYLLFVCYTLGEGDRFKRKQTRAKRSDDVTDGLLRIIRMLDPERDLLCQHHSPRHRLLGLVVPFLGRAGVHQQLCQPPHLRCQVPRVPEGRQTHAAAAG